MPEHRIKLCLVLHNHQPIGNFDDVIERAYSQSYLPFLELFESFPDLRISMHTSGPLITWLQQRRPEYLERIAQLVQSGRIEIIGGAFYEPILTMIPPRDRRGQIQQFSQWLGRRFDTSIRGLWVPERVWEASLVSDLVEAGIEYTVLDDYHFRCAGLAHNQLLGDYVTEDNGSVLRVFPGSEPLRYTIPFHDPQETIDYLHEIAQQRHNATVVFADDGEKFGTWPETHEHVYVNGWLRRFFDALTENRHWIETSTLAHAADTTVSQGKIYLPAASYREMTEWSLPVERQLEFDEVVHQMQNDWRWPRIKKFLRGGFWRNFKVKYEEANELYARMMAVSRRLEEAETGGQALDSPAAIDWLDQARDHLYRGQCNCAYWHGAFGGIYLPHLRNAVYFHLICADNLIDRAVGQAANTIEAADFNFDLRPEVRLCNRDLICWFRPSAGGQMYELDLRDIGHNLLATMQRRREAYHEKVKRGPQQQHGHAASIHDRVVFKQENLDQHLVYDASPRKSLIDHFWSMEATPDQVARCQAPDLGDFATGQYQSTLRRDPQRNQILMRREGRVGDHPITITKGVTLGPSDQPLLIAYLLEGLPTDQTWRFAIEFNFAGLAAGKEDRQFLDAKGQPLGDVGRSLDLSHCDRLSLTDQWLGLQIDLNWDCPGGVWTFPIQTVSQSESGFELVHQSTVVQPHWLVRGDEQGRWAVQLQLSVQTQSPTARPVEPAPLTSEIN